MNIDTKNLEKVHRTVAGTDYDFEDEFDDEFGGSQSKEPEVSLKDLREQSKRTQNVPIYISATRLSLFAAIIFETFMLSLFLILYYYK